MISRLPHRRFTTSALPGLAVAFGTSQLGFAIAGKLGAALLASQGVASGAVSPVSGIPVSIVLGLALNNTVLLKDDWAKPLQEGLQVACKPVLQAGIICVGAKLSALDLFTTGLYGIPCVMASVTAGMTFVPWFGKKMGISDKMASLIAAGTSICGVTAVTAVAPAIGADKKEASIAIANVVAFGTLGMLTMPYIAHAVLPTSHQAGVFLGLAVHDTSQVIGSALTYSAVYADDMVLKAAAVTKLTRNILLAGVVPVLAIKHGVQAEIGAIDAAPGTTKKPVLTFDLVKKYTPMFVLGFIGMSCVRSLGDYSLAQSGAAFGVLDSMQWKQAYSFVGGPLGSEYLLGTALAGVGLTTKLSALKGVGPKPFVVGFTGACVVAGTGMASSLALGYFL